MRHPVTEMATQKYGILSVNQLKKELIHRGAVIRGRKADLIDRLEAYDRNNNFSDVPVILPVQAIPDWPKTGFKQLTLEHKIFLPRLSLHQIDGYFRYRVACDNELMSDVKAIEKGRLLLESARVEACSISKSIQDTYISGIVGAAMKKKVSYNIRIRLDTNTAEVKNSDCECPAGKGPNGTCKHVAAVLLMLQNFIKTGQLDVQKTCTENLQTFHIPRKRYQGSPVKAEDLGSGRENLDDPRPLKFRKMEGYNDHVRNIVTNYTSLTSKDIAFRYAYPRADLAAAVHDHHYLELPFTEVWIDTTLKVSVEEIRKIEINTRSQRKSKMWMMERKYRLTASRFGEICKATVRRNKTKLCASLFNQLPLKTAAVIHGQQYEALAIEKFQILYKLLVNNCGFFIDPEHNFLGATPDGVISDSVIIEVKCPYKYRNSEISEKCDFLIKDDGGNLLLKTDHKYFFQIQGQLNVCKKEKCYFIVYTFKDIFVQEIFVDKLYWEACMLPKLDLFYKMYYRKYVASQLC